MAVMLPLQQQRWCSLSREAALPPPDAAAHTLCPAPYA
eukprot:SAG25_NODE_10982_length_317_cov_0.949541_1_plen_37_part_10